MFLSTFSEKLKELQLLSVSRLILSFRHWRYLILIFLHFPLPLKMKIIVPKISGVVQIVPLKDSLFEVCFLSNLERFEIQKIQVSKSEMLYMTFRNAMSV